MVMKKRIALTVKLAAAAAAALVLLFPIGSGIRDGGTVMYTPVSGAYKIFDYHRLTDTPNEFMTGKTVYIFGMMIYNDVDEPYSL